VKLMREVAEYAGQLGRHDFLNAYTEPEYADAWREAGALFDAFVDAVAPDLVSAAVVQGQIDGLRTASTRLKMLADRWLAHSDRARAWPGPSFDDVNACLDLLYTRWRQYHALAALAPVSADIPRLAGIEWETVLDSPWRAASQAGEVQ
jgi:hypothetical protein